MAPKELRHDPKSAETLIVEHEHVEADPIARRSTRSWLPGNPFAAENRTIIFVCCLVVIPMIVFTAIILWMILVHRIHPSSCPFPDLCLTPVQLNHTKFTPDDYIIDFPAATLVFIASWSSTLSFTCIGCIMAMYGYIVARRLLYLSDTDWKEHSHPSPYQITLLIRILNADLLALWDMGSHGIKDVFWDRSRSEKKRTSMPRILLTTILIFALSIVCSLSIQVADTYLHVTTKALDLVQVRPAPAENYNYGHGLDERCRNRTSKWQGFDNNTDYWSCAMYPVVAVAQDVAILNSTAMHALEMRVSRRDSYLTWRDENGSDMTILGPRSIAEDTDYMASSFGVSTQCRAILNTTCDTWNSTETYQGFSISEFNCTKERAGIDIAGKLLPIQGKLHFMDFHHFFKEPPPFVAEDQYVTNETRATAAGLSLEDGQDVFQNPWNWLANPTVGGENLPAFIHNKTHPYLWANPNAGRAMKMLLHCNTTVWDVIYRVVDGEVSLVKRAKSNSTTTGISSMVTSPYYKQADRWYLNLDMEAKLYRVHPALFLADYSRIASEKFLAPFAGVVELRPVIQAQTRDLQVVSKVPKVAIWTLIAANLVFALLALGMGVSAMMAASVDVHQVHTRMSISGLAAQLFEQTQARQKVSRSAELFEEKAVSATAKEVGESRRIMIKRTETGGTLFSYR